MPVMRISVGGKRQKRKKKNRPIKARLHFRFRYSLSNPSCKFQKLGRIKKGTLGDILMSSTIMYRYHPMFRMKARHIHLLVIILG